MMIMVAFADSARISCIRAFDGSSRHELTKTIVELAHKDGFSCPHLMVFEEQNLIYEFIRDVTPYVSKLADVQFKVIREATRNDLAIIRRAWEKALFNLKMANFIM